MNNYRLWFYFSLVTLLVIAAICIGFFVWRMASWF